MSFEDYFNKPSYYQNQEKTMAEIEGALSSGKLVLLEGACGSGKTLSSLAPALSVASNTRKVVMIATRYHMQMNQFIQEAKTIHEKKPINVVVLTGKIHSCACNRTELNSNGEFNLDECKFRCNNTEDFIDWCEKNHMTEIDLRRDEYYNQWTHINENQGKSICKYYFGYKFYNSTFVKFMPWLFSSVRTPDDLMTWSIDNEICGVYCRYDVMPKAQLIICNYNHIFDPLRFDFICQKLIKRTPDDIIVVIDESHNIEAAAREIYSTELTERKVVNAIKDIDFLKSIKTKSNNNASILRNINEIEMTSCDLNQTELFLKSLQSTMIQIYADWEAKSNPEKDIVISAGEWTEIKLVSPKLPAQKRIDPFKKTFAKILKENSIETEFENILVALDDYSEILKKVRGRSSCGLVASFIHGYFIENRATMNEYYPYGGVTRSSSGELYRGIFLYNTIPRAGVGRFLDSIWAGVLMSATLQPFDNLRRVLGINRETIEHTQPLLFPIANRKTFAVLDDAIAADSSRSPPPDVLVYKNRGRKESENYVKQAIESVIRGTKGNVLIYVQNQTEVKLWKEKHIESDVEILFHTDNGSTDYLRKRFFEAADRGEKSVLITYLHGTLTEGVDFADDYTRAVVIVGVGYPNFKNSKIEAVMTAYQNEFRNSGDGFSYAVGIPTVRKIRQAIGRSVRNPRDYAVRILIDGRFSKECSGQNRPVYHLIPQTEAMEIETVPLKDLQQRIEDFFQNHDGEKIWEEHCAAKRKEELKVKLSRSRVNYIEL